MTTITKIKQELSNDRGMSTIEYAMGSLAAAALAAVLYAVINGGGVVDAIESIITDALSKTPS
ncbi:membrane protein [Corynebacterium flavescens]|uniref:Membrane protein n=1 Tax=Corynebacterium flavescens TaxID=28028 RepID=A0A1L7CJK3_CORFL|nr:membrane protein [Corynebacterium flavescens]